jgi:hypothetical protein
VHYTWYPKYRPSTVLVSTDWLIKMLPNGKRIPRKRFGADLAFSLLIKSIYELATSLISLYQAVLENEIISEMTGK